MNWKKPTLGCLGLLSFVALGYYGIKLGEGGDFTMWPYILPIGTALALIVMVIFGYLFTARKTKDHKPKKQNALARRIWSYIFALGFILINFTACYNCGVNFAISDQEEAVKTSLMDKPTWSADNIPMPHMEDHSLYVSNPDDILSEEVVDSINSTLLTLDDELGIESAMVIVGHIEDDDPIAMVRGIYNKYKVGRDDRGLVIVVGYLDHSYFIAPGSNLEAELTDAETDYLAETYLLPSMKAEQPDSGMLYLARGIYALMADKEQPHMATFQSRSGERVDDFADDACSAYMCFFFVILGWLIFTAFKMESLGILPNSGSYSSSSSRGSSSSYSSGSSSSYSSGGSSHSSGGYGGGSWSGGGSGGRW